MVRDQCGSSTEPCVICSQRAHATTVADVSVYSANYLDRESFSPISVLARTRHVRWKQKTETKEISEWRQDRVVLCEIAGGRNVIAQGVWNWNLPHGNGVRRDVATTNLEPNVIIKRFEWCPFTYWSTVYTADHPRINALNASKRDRLCRIQGTVIQRCITCHFKR